jgi:hypothetical protein
MMVAPATAMLAPSAAMQRFRVRAPVEVSAVRALSCLRNSLIGLPLASLADLESARANVKGNVRGRRRISFSQKRSRAQKWWPSSIS